MPLSDDDLAKLHAAPSQGGLSDDDLASQFAAPKPSRITKLTADAKPSGIIDRIKSAIFVPKDQRDATLGQAALKGVEGIPSQIGKDFVASAKQLGNDIFPTSLSDVIETAAIPLGPMLKVGGDILGMAMSPLTGYEKSFPGRMIEQQTGISRDLVGNVISAFVPIGGEAKAASSVEKGANELSKVAETVKSAEPSAEVGATAGDAIHKQKVQRLIAEGVKPTAGQTVGGRVRRFEEAHKSDPLMGEAIRDQERHALETYNRSLYNRVLAPIGARFKATAQVGREAVKAVGDRVSAEYERLKPKIRMVPDDETVDALASIRSRVGELPPAQESQFENILNNRVLHQLGPDGSMDGEKFKQTESDLLRLSRDFKSSGDPHTRHLGDALEDVTGVLRDNLERSSDPSVRPQLKKINQSWALLTRLEDAAQARKGSAGLITPPDLLGSIRKMDRTGRHRAFARGDAILQQFAEDGDAVLGSKLPDSGTTERASIIHNSLITYALGRLTNPAANAGMSMLRDFAQGAPKTQGMLRSGRNSLQ